MRTVTRVSSEWLMLLAVAVAVLPVGIQPAFAQVTNGTSASRPAARQNVSQDRTQPMRVRPDVARPPAANVSRPPRTEISRPLRTDFSKLPNTDASGPSPTNGASNDSSVKTVTTPRAQGTLPPRQAVQQQTRAQTPSAAVERVQTPPEGNEPPKTAANVSVTVLAIIATNGDNRTDPALQNLAEQLRPTFKFSGYHLAQTDARTVPTGQTATMRLAGSYSLRVTPTQADAQSVAMNVQAVQASRRVLGLQLRLRPGTYQLLGGWPISDGTLLAAVTATPAD
jgi:hypothetical protein